MSEPTYTREEMREACEQNYRAGIAAALAETPETIAVMRDAWLAACQRDAGAEGCCKAMLAALRAEKIGESEERTSDE